MARASPEHRRPGAKSGPFRRVRFEISGGEDGAIAGTLFIMIVDGSETAISKAGPEFKSMGRNSFTLARQVPAKCQVAKWPSRVASILRQLNGTGRIRRVGSLYFHLMGAGFSLC
ncbi:NAD(P)-binding domain-containing protein [Cupriavidus necator]